MVPPGKDEHGHPEGWQVTMVGRNQHPSHDREIGSGKMRRRDSARHEDHSSRWDISLRPDSRQTLLSSIRMTVTTRFTVSPNTAIWSSRARAKERVGIALDHRSHYGDLVVKARAVKHIEHPRNLA